jgi:hypothetical protein
MLKKAEKSGRQGYATVSETHGIFPGLMIAIEEKNLDDRQTRDTICHMIFKV